jgi:hypothetical protein
MTMESISVEMMFVVDTTAYAGNFEREMTAFMTGMLDESGKGKLEAEQFREFLEGEYGETRNIFDDLVVMRPHEEYGDRPCIIYPTPGRLNDGRGKHYDAKEGEKGWPAYESVAIHIGRRPNDRELQILKDRAEEFSVTPRRRGEPFRIRGFRLVTKTVTVTTAEESV